MHNLDQRESAIVSKPAIACRHLGRRYEAGPSDLATPYSICWLTAHTKKLTAEHKIEACRRCTCTNQVSRFCPLGVRCGRWCSTRVCVTIGQEIPQLDKHRNGLFHSGYDSVFRPANTVFFSGSADTRHAVCGTLTKRHYRRLRLVPQCCVHESWPRALVFKV